MENLTANDNTMIASLGEKLERHASFSSRRNRLRVTLRNAEKPAGDGLRSGEQYRISRFSLFFSLFFFLPRLIPPKIGLRRSKSTDDS
ncbi:hypothetical protein B296_00046050 [Ensete ventricosum]|uniref:Uncharacterized protein n=1 Tax=Ensete ventricosum TaxID=4639 RepID=A0A426Z5G0_ENSVE|nr:hypothetical protein B296_00046050 [Ensete ventricosum]